MNLCIRTQTLRSFLLGNVFYYSTTPVNRKWGWWTRTKQPDEQNELPIEQNEQVVIDDYDEEAAKREAIIERMRNISRLSTKHYNVMHGRMPYDMPMAKVHLTVKYNRKMYGIYGSDSGVDPSICWPTKKEIDETLKYEAVAYPYTIKEAMEAAAERKKEEIKKMQQRDEEVAAKFIKLEQWKKELNDKKLKKEAEVLAAKLKKERLIEEVRRHFGFKLDPKDERFKEMLQKREKEQKKQEKLARKEAKDTKMMLRIQQLTAETNEKTEKKS